MLESGVAVEDLVEKPEDDRERSQFGVVLPAVADLPAKVCDIGFEEMGPEVLPDSSQRGTDRRGHQGAPVPWVVW